MFAPSDVATVEFDMVNLAYDPHEYQTDGGDDVAWLSDISEALFMFARVRDDRQLQQRVAHDVMYRPCLSLRRDDPSSLEELREEHEMGVMFFEQLSECNPR